MNVNGNIPYIVVWVEEVKDTNFGTQHIDQHIRCDTFKDAEVWYNELRDRPDVYAAHICLPFRSTDYNTITVWA